ncbi:5'-nucleotidase [Luteolibacter sp. Populi]|uniref:5'-nucleotidase n=1 Tax=Luteolibacter sp. Populi TaxID=3230487 RepID=UPI003467E2BD
MGYSLEQHLVLGIASSALFDTRKEHEIYSTKGLDAYVDYQIEHENEPFAPGPAFPLVKALLKLNAAQQIRPIEVVVMSQNEPAAGLRVMNSIEHHGLNMTRACFTGGASVANYLRSYNVSLFLSKNREDVEAALKERIAAGWLYDAPLGKILYDEALRIAFDGDAVIFSDESEKIYQERGIEAFKLHEEANAGQPMPKGPFADFLQLLSEISKQKGLDGEELVRTAIITARNSPADKRVIHTLRAYGIRINELFFMGGVAKSEALKAFKPHIFFDDQETHASPASQFVPSALVPVRKVPVLESDLEELTTSGRISKRSFEVQARSILKGYVPLSGDRLDDRMRTWINDKSEMTSAERWKCLETLKKYDLTNLGLADVTLNRDGVVDAGVKLRKLE